MALSYGPARALACDRRRGFRAWVDCDDRYGRNFVWCAVTPTSACKHYQHCLCKVSALPTRRFKNEYSPEKLNRASSVIGNPLKMDIQLSRATYVDIFKYMWRDQVK